MRLIAETAGVAERTLFNIYGSKDRLFATNARERSEETIAGAHAASGGGMDFFRELAERLAEKTFEAPALARALAPILIEHADLVGLPEVYERFAGAVLEAMRDDGELVIADIAMTSRLVCMRMVTTILLWAKGEIVDEDLETHLRLAICQTLLPYAQGSMAKALRDEARSLTGALLRQPFSS